MDASRISLSYKDLSVLFVIFLVSTLFLVLVFFPLEQKQCRLETGWFGGGLGAMLDHLSFYHHYFLLRRAPPGLFTVEAVLIYI